MVRMSKNTYIPSERHIYNFSLQVTLDTVCPHPFGMVSVIFSRPLSHFPYSILEQQCIKHAHLSTFKSPEHNATVVLSEPRNRLVSILIFKYVLSSESCTYLQISGSELCWVLYYLILLYSLWHLNHSPERIEIQNRLQVRSNQLVGHMIFGYIFPHLVDLATRIKFVYKVSLVFLSCQKQYDQHIVLKEICQVCLQFWLFCRHLLLVLQTFYLRARHVRHETDCYQSPSAI